MEYYYFSHRDTYGMSQPQRENFDFLLQSEQTKVRFFLRGVYTNIYQSSISQVSFLLIFETISNNKKYLLTNF